MKKKEIQSPINNIIDNYIQIEESLVNQLYLTYDRHAPSIGSFREEIWKQLFQQIIPKKFVIEQSVFIIDSEGQVSNEVDFAIFDETYTPYIFKAGRLKFIPIEAVAVVVECKSTKTDPKQLEPWSNSINKLSTSLESYTRTVNAVIYGDNNSLTKCQTSTRPIRILCCLKEKFAVNKNGKLKECFDFILFAQRKSRKIGVVTCKPDTTLQDWYLQLNHAKTLYGTKEQRKHGEMVKYTVKVNGEEEEKEARFEDYVKTKSQFLVEKNLENYAVKVPRGEKGEVENISLLSFNFQLNQILMLINNPIFFPHIAYANMFNKFYETKEEE